MGISDKYKNLRGNKLFYFIHENSSFKGLYHFLSFSENHPLLLMNEKKLIKITHLVIDISVIDCPGVHIANNNTSEKNYKLFTPEMALKNLKIIHCHNGTVCCEEIWDNVRNYEILIPSNFNLEELSIS